MADAGEDEACDPAFEALEKSELAIFQRDDEIRLTNLDAVFGGNGENRLWIDTQTVEGGEQFAGGGIGGDRKGGPEASEAKTECGAA